MLIAYEGARGRQAITHRQEVVVVEFQAVKRRRWPELAGVFLSVWSIACFRPLRNVQSRLIRAAESTSTSPGSRNGFNPLSRLRFISWTLVPPVTQLLSRS